MFLLTNNVELLPDATLGPTWFEEYEMAMNTWRVLDSFGGSDWQQEEYDRCREIFWAQRDLAEQSAFRPARFTFGLGHRM